MPAGVVKSPAGTPVPNAPRLAEAGLIPRGGACVALPPLRRLLVARRSRYSCVSRCRGALRGTKSSPRIILLGCTSLVADSKGCKLGRPQHAAAPSPPPQPAAGGGGVTCGIMPGCVARPAVELSAAAYISRPAAGREVSPGWNTAVLKEQYDMFGTRREQVL